MKKLLSVIAIFAMCMGLCSCSADSEENINSAAPVRENGDPTVRYDIGRVNKLDGLELGGGSENNYAYIVQDLEELEAESDIIVIGKFVGDSVVCYERFWYSDLFGKDLLSQIISCCSMEITQVFSGAVEVGDIVNVYQSEGVYEERFISDSLLTPMQNGDEWLFFLRKTSEANSEHFNGYWCVNDNCGRYPTKNVDSNAPVTLQEPDVEGVEFDGVKYGVYFRSDFKARIYKQIKEKYEI